MEHQSKKALEVNTASGVEETVLKNGVRCLHDSKTKKIKNLTKTGHPCLNLFFSAEGSVLDGGDTVSHD